MLLFMIQPIHPPLDEINLKVNFYSAIVDFHFVLKLIGEPNTGKLELSIM